MTETVRPIRARRATPAARALSLLAAAAIAASRRCARRPRTRRSAPGLPIIRDTEIENLLRDYVTPILRVAGLAKQNVKVVILNDRAFNAFVMDGRHIFINAGALFDAKTPNEIIGVLAHETGHLADGHLMRFREKLAQAQTQSIVAMLLASARSWPAPAAAAPAASATSAAPRSWGRNRRSCTRCSPMRAAGRPGRPCRREIPQRDPPVGPRAWSICSSG